mgnify:CR=1 FL=1
MGQADYNRVVRQRLGTGDYWFRYQPVVDQDLSLAVEDRPTMECWVKERNGYQTLYVYNAWGALLWKQELDKGPGHAPRTVVWRYRYRLNGKLEKLTLGKYPALTLVEAQALLAAAQAEREVAGVRVAVAAQPRGDVDTLAGLGQQLGEALVAERDDPVRG